MLDLSYGLQQQPLNLMHAIITHMQQAVSSSHGLCIEAGVYVNLLVNVLVMMWLGQVPLTINHDDQVVLWQKNVDLSKPATQQFAFSHNICYAQLMQNLVCCQLTGASFEPMFTNPATQRCWIFDNCLCCDELSVPITCAPKPVLLGVATAKCIRINTPILFHHESLCDVRG